MYEEDKIMQYEIVGKTVPAVEITLDRGESMYTQSGGMIWQTEGIEMKKYEGWSDEGIRKNAFR